MTKTTAMAGVPGDIRRVLRSRATMKTMAASAQSAWALNPSDPGRTMIITPRKPMAMAR